MSAFSLSCNCVLTVVKYTDMLCYVIDLENPLISFWVTIMLSATNKQTYIQKRQGAADVTMTTVTMVTFAIRFWCMWRRSEISSIVPACKRPSNEVNNYILDDRMRQLMGNKVRPTTLIRLRK